MWYKNLTHLRSGTVQKSFRNQRMSQYQVVEQKAPKS